MAVHGFNPIKTSLTTSDYLIKKPFRMQVNRISDYLLQKNTNLFP